LAASDFVDSTGGSMYAGGFVAFAGVAPVEDVHAAVGPITQVDAAKPFVAEEKGVFAVLADVPRSAALEDFLICAAAKIIQHVQLAAIRLGPIIAQVNHRSRVSMSTAVGIRFSVARVAPAFANVKMPMIGVHIY